MTFSRKTREERETACELCWGDMEKVKSRAQSQSLVRWGQPWDRCPGENSSKVGGWPKRLGKEGHVGWGPWEDIKDSAPSLASNHISTEGRWSQPWSQPLSGNFASGMFSAGYSSFTMLEVICHVFLRLREENNANYLTIASFPHPCKSCQMHVLSFSIGIGLASVHRIKTISVPLPGNSYFQAKYSLFLMWHFM